jgi:hypothetical protein
MKRGGEDEEGDNDSHWQRGLRGAYRQKILTMAAKK